MPWLEIIIAWALLGGVYLGLGAWVWSALRPGAEDRCTPFVAFWLGWGASIVMLQLWQCLWPVNGAVLLLLAPVAASGLWHARARRLFASEPLNPVVRGVSWAAALVWIAFVANRALGPPANPDTCLYHMQAVRWASQYSIVPGIANFNLLLGFNNAYSLYVAMLDVGPFHHQAQHLANGLLLLAASLPGLAATVQLVRPAEGRRLEELLVWATIFAVSIDQFLGPNLSSPAADAAVWGLDAALVILSLEPYLKSAAVTPHRLRTIAFIGGAALATKASAALVVAPFSIFVFASWLRSAKPAPRKVLKQVLGLGLLALMSVGPWAARSVVTSGYPFFPSTALGPGVPWCVPRHRLAGLVGYIKAYARYQKVRGFDHVAHGEWAAHWLSREWLNDRTFLIPAVVIVLSMAMVFAAGLATRRWPPLLQVMLPLVGSMALWWFTAPDTRFLDPLQWISAAVAFLCAWSYAEPRPEWLGWLVCFGMVLSVQVAGLAEYASALRLQPAVLAEPGPESFSEGELASGERVRIYAGCCLDLPCGFDLAHVHAREKGHLEHGFYSDEVTSSP